MPNAKRPKRSADASPTDADTAALELFDPRRGDPPFRIDSLRLIQVQNPSRVNGFTILWVRKGAGTFHVDLRDHRFTGPALLFANPYQTVFITDAGKLDGVRLRFHANFFCIETYHEEVGCNGVLFNDIYGRPVLPISRELVQEIDHAVALMQEELKAAGLAHSELLLSYLKVLLIKATRLKLEQQPRGFDARSATPEIISRLVELVEANYREKHSPSEYAQLLGISGKALNKLVKNHLGKPLSVLIRERILKHAKWHLLHTRKPVKEVAAELGFADEYYFSRLFKRSTGLAPTAFRDFETAIRGGRNLSI